MGFEAKPNGHSLDTHTCTNNTHKHIHKHIHTSTHIFVLIHNGGCPLESGKRAQKRHPYIICRYIYIYMHIIYAYIICICIYAYNIHFSIGSKGPRRLFSAADGDAGAFRVFLWPRRMSHDKIWREIVDKNDLLGFRTELGCFTSTFLSSHQQ